jgi:hypothetical protein
MVLRRSKSPIVVIDNVLYEAAGYAYSERELLARIVQCEAGGEGEYFLDERKAKLEFYRNQKVLAFSNMDQKKRWYEDAKARYDQVDLLVKNILKEFYSVKNSIYCYKCM